MITSHKPGVRVWLATAPVDMRKSFDGLAECVRAQLGHDPMAGDLFVFRNKGGHLLKVLWWDKNGLAIYYKRIELGMFCFPKPGDEASLAIDSGQLLRLLAGLELAAQRSA